MPESLELLPAEPGVARSLFASDADYSRFRESFMDEVQPKQDVLLEARRLSEEEARQRLLR